MKKVANKLLLITILIIAISACKKNSDNTTSTTTGSVVGFWGGTGTYATSGATQTVSIVFKTGGTMRFYGGVSKATDTATLASASKADGTYTVSGSTITTSYSLSGALLLLVSTANSSFTTMTGTAGLSPASSGIGSFTFTKQ